MIFGEKNHYFEPMVKRLFVTLLIVFFVCCPVYALEERFEDVIAAVVVGSTFRLSVDKNRIDFGLIKPGERIEFYPGRYYNQVTALSNNGKTWYLKMSLPHDLQGARGRIIPRQSLKWQVHSTDGQGIKQDGWNSFQQQSTLVYTSGPQDSQGNEVKIRLKYALDTPGDAIAGYYQATIYYTITESP